MSVDDFVVIVIISCSRVKTCNIWRFKSSGILRCVDW